ncbi:MAG TPA: type II toxin-antitoxin system HipA family toxin YjjJ [Hydrogenophaga sp.]|nr:type II toxin-antitoxin system HipA family toxin YjjJ [Hydrogenophaga sp.]
MTPTLQPALLSALRSQGGHATSSDLQQRLGVSQPTVSRALSPALASGLVVKVGAGRSQRYLLPRTVEGVGSLVLIHAIQADGTLAPFGTLYPLNPGGYWMDEIDKIHGQSAFHESLPWFLYDMRPQGFLGRAFAGQHPGLHLPPQLLHWSDDHILKALVNAGEDLPGNLLLGASAFDRYQALPPPAHSLAPVVTNPATDYPAMALRALSDPLPGSSAGGEQPKFTAVRNGHPVLVKFSPGGDSPVDQRWRDLLICEALALHTLQDAGIAAAHTELVLAASRVFLESRRFDRTPQGRVGMVSLETYDGKYIGKGNNWVTTAEFMDRAGTERLSPANVQTLRLLDAYGALIANDDRHHGNISLLLHDHRWHLAPTYDMLPMLYRPIAGELVPRDFASTALRPSVHTLAVWPQACELAVRFWETAAQDERISAGFRELAWRNGETVKAL